MLEVAVAVIVDGQQQVLIARRHKHQHQGGLWEFPGGKRESGETRMAALQREIAEEVGLRIEAAQPMLQIRHDYGDREVLLDVWQVTAFSGQAQSNEGQQLLWCAISDLEEFAFPAANQPILESLLASMPVD